MRFFDGSRIAIVLAVLLLIALFQAVPLGAQEFGTAGGRVEPAHRAAWVVSPVFPDRWQVATAAVELPGSDGYLVAGQRDDNQPGQIAAWVMKLDRHGRTHWWRNFDEAREVRGLGLAALPDGGAFLAGSVGDGLRARPWISRISTDARVFWERSLPAPSDAWSGIEALIPSAAGDLLAAGTDYFPDGKTKTWLLRLTAEGEVLQRWEVPSPTPRGVHRLIELPDRSLALAGPLLAATESSIAERRRRDAWVARLSSEGEVIWRADLSGGPQEEIGGLAPDGPSGLLVAGWQLDAPWHATQAWTRRFASNGRAIGELTFGGRDMDLLAAVLPGPSGGHWLIGSTHPGPHREAAQPATAWKRSLDAGGVLGEAQILGTAARMDLATALRSRDGGLLTVGWRTIRRQLLPDIWVARFVLPTG